MASPFVEIEVDDRVVKVTNPDRVYFPESGATKLDLVEYYLAVGPGIVNALFERPCMLHRFPKGLAGDKVHQKRLPAGAPPWVETVRLHFPRWNRTADELCVTELASVIWAVQMSTVEFHPWNSRRDDPEKPDEWRIDLDPGPLSDYAQVRRVAHVAHEVLDELGAVGFPKTTGGKGMHVYVRIRPDHGHKVVRRAALAFAREVERRTPDDVTTQWWRKDRDPHHLFVDYNQNARDHTIAAAYSVRGLPDARVSTPIRWDEVDDADPHDFTIFTVPERFSRLGDLHEDIDDHVFDIAPLLEWADRDEAEGKRDTGRDPEEAAVNAVVNEPSTSARSSACSPSTGRPRWWPGSTTTRSRSSSSRVSSSGTPTTTPTSSFLVVEGNLTIQLRDGDVSLREGQLYVVPRGVEHCPIADGEVAVYADRARRRGEHRRRPAATSPRRTTTACST